MYNNPLSFLDPSGYATLDGGRDSVREAKRRHGERINTGSFGWGELGEIGGDPSGERYLGSGHAPMIVAAANDAVARREAGSLGQGVRVPSNDEYYQSERSEYERRLLNELRLTMMQVRAAASKSNEPVGSVIYRDASGRLHHGPANPYPPLGRELDPEGFGTGTGIFDVYDNPIAVVVYEGRYRRSSEREVSQARLVYGRFADQLGLTYYVLFQKSHIYNLNRGPYVFEPWEADDVQ